jgi:ribosomal protein S30
MDRELDTWCIRSLEHRKEAVSRLQARNIYQRRLKTAIQEFGVVNLRTQGWRLQAKQSHDYGSHARSTSLLRRCVANSIQSAASLLPCKTHNLPTDDTVTR